MADGLAWLALAIAALALVLREVTWSWQPAIIVAAFAPYFVLAALVAVALFAVRHRWLGLILAGAATVVFLAVEAPPYFASTEAGQGNPITVLQANLRLGSADAGHLVQLVTANQVDVLTTEELSPEEVVRLDAAGIATALPYRYLNAHEGGDGVGIFSRYPLTNETYDSADFDLGVESADVAGPDGPLTLFAVHLTPPWPYPSHHWVSELKRLHSMLEAVPLTTTVIVGGDFNATYDNAQFRTLLTASVADAAAANGAGILRTYPSDRWFPPLIGIDHVLSRQLLATHVRTVALPGSDHRGLLVQLLPLR